VTTLPPLQGLDVEVAARGLDKPVFVTAPPGDDRLFVVEQDGRIQIVADGEVAPQPFLDIDDLVGSGGLEQGLLGMAFHPGYASNGRFFVYYTDNEGDSRVVEYSADGDLADPSSAQAILAVAQPAANHNGGMLAFGPDGYLYIGFGDGGGANDRFGHGQRTDTLLGSIVRIDVDSAQPYAVPADNPYVAGGGAPEVWATGLRNPWRFSFDGELAYIGDVGQGEYEEVSVVSIGDGGANLGWPVYEGTACRDQSACGGAFVAPALSYDHSEGCSVIGGYVYRGASIPELNGSYFYSDWCSGFLRSFRLEGGVATDLADWTPGTLGNTLTLGTDGFGELYMGTGEGFIFRLVAVR
jgi:glucose/arabinose dehydrogenase